MRSKPTALAMAAALAGAAVLATSTGAVAQRWHGYEYRGWGPAAGIGLAAGALIGGAVAAATTPWYGPGYYGDYVYVGNAQDPWAYSAVDPYYYGGVGLSYGDVAPTYGTTPRYNAYAYSEAPADQVGYCARRYRSYDPSSGTYLGNDGIRHACP